MDYIALVHSDLRRLCMPVMVVIVGQNFARVFEACDGSLVGAMSADVIPLLPLCKSSRQSSGRCRDRKPFTAGKGRCCWFI